MSVEYVTFLGYSKDRCGYCGIKGMETIGIWAYMMNCDVSDFFFLKN